MTHPENFTIPDLARRLNVSPEKIKNAIRLGAIKALDRPGETRVTHYAAFEFAHVNGRSVERLMKP